MTGIRYFSATNTFQLSTKLDVTDTRFEYSLASSHTLPQSCLQDPRNFLVFSPACPSQPAAGGLPGLELKYKGKMVPVFDWVCSIVTSLPGN